MEDYTDQLIDLIFSYRPSEKTRQLVGVYAPYSMGMEAEVLRAGIYPPPPPVDPGLSDFVLHVPPLFSLLSSGVGGNGGPIGETQFELGMDKLKTHTIDFEAWAAPLWGDLGHLAPLIARSCAALVTGLELEGEFVDIEELKDSVEAIIPPTTE